MGEVAGGRCVQVFVCSWGLVTLGEEKWLGYMIGICLTPGLPW